MQDFYYLTRSQATNLDSSNLKQCAEDNFKIGENGRESSQRVENTVGKDLYCRQVNTKACLGKG